MKITLQNTVRFMVIGGLALMIGTLAFHEFIMRSPYWEGSHPGWMNFTLLGGLGLLVIGICMAFLTKNSILRPGVIALIIAVLIWFIYPTVC